MVDKIFLGLGSNVGDRKEYLLKSVEKLNNSKKCKVINSSSVYETSPFGVINQQNFLNAVIEIKCDYSANELFELVKKIEVELGRTPSLKKWGPREIDIDILFYNQLIYNQDNLNIPHSEILKRDFVLVPLIEIAPTFVHPIYKKRMSEFDVSEIEHHIIHKLDYKLI